MDTLTNPYPGIRHLHRTTDGPLDIDVVRIDTTYLDLHFAATGSADRGRTTSDFANLYAVDVAWNGDLFRPLGFEPEGLAFGGRGASVALWPSSMDTAAEGFVYIKRTDTSEVRIARDLAPNANMAGWVGAVGGRPVIMEGGVVATTFDCTDAEVDPCNPQPRTAIGTSIPATVLPPQFVYVVVVGGRTASSRGMRMEELAALMANISSAFDPNPQYAISDAIALDGGSSSTLYIRSEMGIQNQLADGVERLVANHIGVKYSTGGQKYTLEGRVADQNDVAVVNASVRRDDGMTTTTVSAGPGLDNYFFPNDLDARYVCITVHKTGYLTQTACKEINPAGGSISYLNVVLSPGTDPPDAGTPDAPRVDAAGPRPDGSADAAVNRDGGSNSLVGDTGCSCSAGGTGAHGGFVLAAAVIAAALRRRRR
jgi:MYXO-CTERM domain-containing protein